MGSTGSDALGAGASSIASGSDATGAGDDDSAPTPSAGRAGSAAGTDSAAGTGSAGAGLPATAHAAPQNASAPSNPPRIRLLIEDRIGVYYPPCPLSQGALLSYLNGPTDGWALLRESIDKVLDRHQSQLTREQHRLLKDMRHAVNKAIERR